MTAISDDLRRRLAGVKLLSLDTDGVLTDGGLYYTDAGDELRKFNVKDGLGMVLLQEAGVPIAIVSAGRSPAIAHRAERLGVKHVRLGVEDKLGAVTELCADLGIGLAEVAHMGDDLNDLPLQEAAGCALTVPDAAPAILANADYVTEKAGGAGAVREVCELILAARDGA